MSASRINTTFRSNLLNDELGDYLYDKIMESVSWEEGVRSKHGFTRLAHTLTSGQLFDEIVSIITPLIGNITDTPFLILGVYLNYYRDGTMYTPNHTHPGTKQFVLSLGGTRTLTLGKKAYAMKHGDAALFGSITHGVPKEPDADPRISIATFMLPAPHLQQPPQQ